MKYITITGHIANLNHVVHRYLARYDIQLEQRAVSGLTEPFTSLNPYAMTLQKAELFSDIVGDAPTLHLPMTASDAVNLVEASAIAYDQRGIALRAMEDQLAQITATIENLKNFLNFDEDLSTLENLEFVHHRFGRMHLTNYRQYEKFLADDERIVFAAIKRDQSYVWGVYFTPTANKDAIDTIFASLGFEVVDCSQSRWEESPKGTPTQLIAFWHEKCNAMQMEIATETQNTLAHITGSRERLAIACSKVKSLYASFDVKKYASLSKGRRVFTFSGWMTADDANAMEAEIVHDDLAVFTHHVADQANPPTVLKNPPIIRQFEFFTRLYGLPQYGEIDPTPILAVTYTLLFGLMFGDVGHGFVLGLLGLFFWYKWQKPLGCIMAVVGASAMIFGFMYGSIFGFEDILPALWIRPAADISQTLIFAGGLGVVLIAMSMFFYMVNAFRQRRIADLLFSANGVAGFVFYAAALWLGVRVFVLGLPVTRAVVAIAVFPLVFVAFKPILGGVMAGKNPVANISFGQFIFNTMVELFETLLTYATNTISFVRVGAFAVSHAGMMHVVLQISQGTAGIGHWLIIILGNVLVMGIEGLLVGIQVLRLDFYEIFSRFYTGGGRGFSSSRWGQRV